MGLWALVLQAVEPIWIPASIFEGTAPIARSSLLRPVRLLLLDAGSFPLLTSPFLSVSWCFLSFLDRLSLPLH